MYLNLQYGDGVIRMSNGKIIALVTLCPSIACEAVIIGLLWHVKSYGMGILFGMHILFALLITYKIVKDGDHEPI